MPSGIVSVPTETTESDRPSPEEGVTTEEAENLFDATTGSCWMENPCEANAYVVDNFKGEEPNYIMYVDFTWTGGSSSDVNDHILGVLAGVADSYPPSLLTYAGSVILNIEADEYNMDETIQALEDAGLEIDEKLNPRLYDRESNDIPITLESLKRL